MPWSKEMIPLAHVNHRLAAMTGAVTPGPRKTYDLALRGAFPADFRNGRWYVHERDLAKVAAALGITVPPDGEDPNPADGL